jgi:SHS2 domain-containing protein
VEVQVDLRRRARDHRSRLYGLQVRPNLGGDIVHETFDHTADVGLRVQAADLDGLFAEAAEALFGLIVANPQDVRPVQEVNVELEGGRYDDLLFDFLAELLFLFSTQHLVFSQFEVRVHEHGVTATLRGEPVDRDRHQLDMEVKAITYHGLKVEEHSDGWLAEVIVDL